MQAEVGVSLTDLAVLTIADPNSGKLLDYFYGQQGLSVRTSTPLTINTDQITQTVLDTIKGGGGGFGEGGIFDIRQQFVDTPYWNASLTTDADGTATFSVTLPDNLTTWRLDARAVTAGDDGMMLVGQDTLRPAQHQAAADPPGDAALLRRRRSGDARRGRQQQQRRMISSVDVTLQGERRDLRRRRRLTRRRSASRRGRACASTGQATVEDVAQYRPDLLRQRWRQR